MYDVVIIGAGVVGSSIARELARYKLSVALLEKEEEPAFGVSKSNSGIIHPGTHNSPDSMKGRLCVEGNRLTRGICKELRVDLKEVGQLIVAFKEEDFPLLEDLKKKAEALGVPKLKIVDREWLQRNEPNLNPEAIAALYAPTAGIVSPYRLVYGLCENAVHNGVEIHTSTRAEGISVSRGTDPLCTPVFEVLTGKGAFKARYLVNAAGLFADDISKMAGIRDFRIMPRKGEEFLLDKKREHLTNHLLFPLPSGVSKGMLVIKTDDGNPMIGPTAEEVEDKEDLATSEQGLEKVIKNVRRLVPSIDPDDIITYFAGLRPAAGDDFIIRHEEMVPGFINVAGIQSPGLTAAPAIALMVTDLLRKAGLAMKKKLFFRPRLRKTIHLFSIPLKKTKGFIKKDPAYGDILCRCEMVSAREVIEAIVCGAKTLDGIKFRTRAQAGRCHGGFCTTRIMKILSARTDTPLRRITKRGKGSEIVKKDRADAF